MTVSEFSRRGVEARIKKHGGKAGFRKEMARIAKLAVKKRQAKKVQSDQTV